MAISSSAEIASTRPNTITSVSLAGIDRPLPNRRVTHLAVLLLSATLLGPIRLAEAQTIDYGPLEEMFGEPVTTSATGKPQRSSEAPVAMDIVSAEDIRRSGAATIPQILSRLAGIDVYTWSNNSADLAIRGMNHGTSNRVLVMVNGREVYTDALGLVPWQNIAVRLDEIRQIEVIKGPNSALYGYNAGAGVINIITYNPSYDRVNVERLSVDSNGSEEGSVVQTGRWANGGIRASAGWSKTPESQFHPSLASDAVARDNPSINRNLNVDSQTAVGERSQLRVQGSIADGNSRSTLQIPFYIDLLLAAGQIEFSSETDYGTVDATLMHNHFDVHQVRNASATASLQNDVTVAKVQDLFKLGTADTLRVGSEYRRDAMPSVPLHGGDLASQTAALSGMWEHGFGGGVTLLNALRGERYWLDRSGSFLPGTPWSDADYDRALTGWSFNSALAWRPTDVDSLKLSVSRGLALPSLGEFGIMNATMVPFAPSTIPTTPFLSFGSPTLQPTRVMHYELSYERDLPAIDSSARIAAYHQVVTGLRDLSSPMLVSPPPSPLITTTYINVGGAHLNGVEFEAKGRIAGDWRWGANYSYELVSDDSAIDLYQNFTASTPHHKANGNVGWQSGPWEADLYLRYVSRTKMPEQMNTTIYALIPIAPVVSLSQRLSYAVTPRLRLEAVAASGFADNPVSSEKHRVLLSAVASF